MRRPFVTCSFAVAVALAPAALFAQTAPPAQTPPPAAAPAAPAAPAQPAPIKLGFKAPAGLLLVQIKPDQTAVFEELVAKLRAGLAKSENAELKQQGNFKVYKASEPMQANVLYVLLVDPAMGNTEYAFLDVLNKTLTDDEKRAPATRELFTKFAGAFANINILNLTAVQ